MSSDLDLELTPLSKLQLRWLIYSVTAWVWLTGVWPTHERLGSMVERCVRLRAKRC